MPGPSLRAQLVSCVGCLRTCAVWMALGGVVLVLGCLLPLLTLLTDAGMLDFLLAALCWWYALWRLVVRVARRMQL